MTDPRIVERDALNGVNVAISVSDSADLPRLGLTPEHCNLAVAEIARAVLLAGGNITYGGRLRPEGFTQLLIDEVRRFGDGRHALTICVPESEYKDIDTSELKRIDSRLGTSARLRLLDRDGNVVALRDVSTPTGGASEASAGLSAMRKYITKNTDARVLIGGQLWNFKGSVPGILEEASLSLEAEQPLYVAGGYGGAAAAAAQSIGRDSFSWSPKDFPRGGHDSVVQGVLEGLSKAARTQEVEDGLNAAERRQLASTHRAGDIATLIVQGLSRIGAGRSGSIGTP